MHNVDVNHQTLLRAKESAKESAKDSAKESARANALRAAVGRATAGSLVRFARLREALRLRTRTPAEARSGLALVRLVRAVEVLEPVQGDD